MPANFVNYSSVSSADTLALGCPVTDTSVQPKNFFFSIRVDVRDNSAAASVVARRVTRSPRGVLSFGPSVDRERSVEREKAERRAAQAEADTAPTPEEERAMFQERVTARKREPVDTRWVATTNDLIRTDLEHALAGGSAKLVEVECRTSTCSATLEWSSQHEAETKYESLFQRPLRANCGVSILLPEQPGDRPEPVRTTALFDCPGWRASGSVPLEGVPHRALAEARA